MTQTAMTLEPIEHVILYTELGNTDSIASHR